MISPSTIAGYPQSTQQFLIRSDSYVNASSVPFLSSEIHIGEMKFSILAGDPRSRPKKKAPKKAPAEPTEKPRK